MTDTTITSEHVVYRAAKKVYSDEVLHVFRSFRRTGSSNLNGTERQEHYEVVLEDWLLENLNQRYVIPEDFNAYKKLTRPTAKGIFGNLHLWFHASQGRPVEKDYADLCNLLNIQVYPHLSKIKSTMGLALNELIGIKYLSNWDVQKMSSKAGYKVVLVPGEELMAILENTRPERRDQSPAMSEPLTTRHNQVMGEKEQAAADLLRKYGVLPAKAEGLVRTFGAQIVSDTVEYLASQVSKTTRKKVSNPAGLIIYSIENALPVPASFVSSRKRTLLEAASQHERSKELELRQKELAYSEWRDHRQEALLRERFSEAELQIKLEQVVAEMCQQNAQIRHMPLKTRLYFASRHLQKEIAVEVGLPSFAEWQKLNEQLNCF